METDISQTLALAGHNEREILLILEAAKASDIDPMLISKAVLSNRKELPTEEVLKDLPVALLLTPSIQRKHFLSREQMADARTIMVRRVVAPSRTNCAGCNATIPPGRPGRLCKACRDQT